ncbi:hypothetical protein [Falsiroseomonas sp. E2-1-a20]|uniref:hypothetical protein n=1 Tax=Falsiroseomonas sp. E2-1-a20 TaxID=3239300 RepID=UPI003F32DFDF
MEIITGIELLGIISNFVRMRAVAHFQAMAWVKRSPQKRPPGPLVRKTLITVKLA